MEQLSKGKIKKLFKAQSITDDDYLTSQELYSIICNMNQAPFDEETFEEIWNQCKLNIRGEAKLADFIDYLISAEEILCQKIKEVNVQYQKKQAERKHTVNDFNDQRKIKQEIVRLQDQKLAIFNTLAIIRKPFVASIQSPIKQVKIVQKSIEQHQYQYQQQENNIIQQLFEYNNSESAETLTTICYLIIVLIILTWIDSLFVNQFASFVVYFIIFGQFAFQVISRKVIKFNLIILSILMILDIVWLICYMSKFWDLPNNYDLSIRLSTYLKFSMALNIVCFVLRIFLIYFYLSQYQLDEQLAYEITIVGTTLTLQIQVQPLTNRNPYSLLLRDYFNRKMMSPQ